MANHEIDLSNATDWECLLDGDNVDIYINGWFLTSTPIADISEEAYLQIFNIAKDA